MITLLPWPKFAGVLSKPVALDELFATVNEALCAPATGDRTGVRVAVRSAGWTPACAIPMLGPT